MAVATLAGAQEPRPSEVLLVVRGATVHPLTSAPIVNGVVLVEGATLRAVGNAAQPVPAKATVIDVSGLHVYPGLVHAGTDLGLVEIDAVRATDDRTEIGDNNANARAEVAFHADSFRLLPALGGGVVAAHVVPAGGIVSGTSAVMRLDGWNWEEMTVRAPVGMHLQFPQVGTAERDGQPAAAEAEQRDRQLETLDELFAAARSYSRSRATTAVRDPRLEALVPVLDGALPLFVHAPRVAQIRRALEWLEEQKLTNVVLVSGPDAAYEAERLAERKVRVILDQVLVEPRRDTESYDFAFAAAARLHERGVTLAIAGQGDGTFARNLPFEAAMAAAHGLPAEAALRAITLGAAEILGVADRLGSLEAGKEASFIVTDGDPLEMRTNILRVFVAGREVDLERDPQRQLYRRYDSRPRAPR